MGSVDERVITRIRNLLALAADGSSPHEAAIAAKRARSLMDRYQLTLKDLVESDGFATDFSGKPRKFIPKWEEWLVIAVAEYNDCQVRRLCQADTGLDVFRFEGFDSDVIIAKYMYDYLAENGKRLCKEYMRLAGNNHYYASIGTAFKQGYVVELVAKIKKMIEARRREFVSNNKELMVIKRELVVQKFGVVETAKEKVKTPGNADLDIAYQVGRAAGRQTNIHVGVDDTERESIEPTNGS